MALGGGHWTTQNKILPGSYINFVSANRARASISDRGYATMALNLDYGVDGEVFTVTNEDFFKNSQKIFGYSYTHDKLKGLRDLFENTRILYAYKLNANGVKASNALGEAKYMGTRGNAFKVVVEQDVDDPTVYLVELLLEDVIVERQRVKTMADLTSDYVTWKASATLAPTAGMPFENGVDGTVTAQSHQDYLDKIEAYNFNVMGVVTEDSTINQLYGANAKRMREEQGVKYQVVCFNTPYDHEAVINVVNPCTDEGEHKGSIVYWWVGASAGCELRESLESRVYKGSFAVDTNYTQIQLEQSILKGEAVLHRVGEEIQVLSDINSLVTETEEKGYVFKDNQTIRVIDSVAETVAHYFNTRFRGKVPNDPSGRIGWRSTVNQVAEEHQKARAIQNFDPDTTVVLEGDHKKAVYTELHIEVINTMSQLYMTCIVA